PLPLVGEGGNPSGFPGEGGLAYGDSHPTQNVFGHAQEFAKSNSNEPEGFANPAKGSQPPSNSRKRVAHHGQLS
ncbi:hypothetical protein KAH43_05200, partial [Candidatus Bipolaricaulota bacterium]|nr:hypothetical protein [Candidatus Bipolaricaulota bacterium]